MRLNLISAFLLVWIGLAQAVAPELKSMLVSYPKDTPDQVLSTAKKAIKEAGGFITHEYTLIKAFAAKAPATVFKTVQALDSQYNAVFEEDQIVTANKGS